MLYHRQGLKGAELVYILQSGGYQMALQDKVIDRLKELGVNDGLWLVEVSDYQTAKQFYSARHIDDLTQFDEPEDTHIIYYHENGSIEQHSCFNPDDQKSFNEAINWIAKYLGADIKEVN